jgi:acyl carrier protein
MNGELQPEIDLLRNWILSQNPKIQSVGDEDELIESRVLDSFAFLQFVLYIEEVFGREVVLDESVSRNFRTLAAICRHFKMGNGNAEARHA